MSVRAIRWMVALLALTPALGTGCGGEVDPPRHESQRATGEPVKVRLAPVRTGALDRTIDVVGTLYGDDQATIGAKTAGRVAEIFVDVGDRVAAGAALAQIDPTDYRLVVEQRDMALRQALAELGLEALPDSDFDVTRVATVERARFQAANAKAKLERAKRLFDQNPPLISEQDYQDIQTAWQVAQQNRDVAALEARSQLALAHARASELAAARQRLADATVRAPGAADATRPTTAAAFPRFAVSARLVSPGEYVREGDALFRLVADDPIKFRGAVPERYVAQVRVGQSVGLRVEGGGEPFAGRISRINPAIDIGTRTFQVEALVDNPARTLRPGAFARAAITVGQDADISFVPAPAVISFAGADTIFTVSDGKAVEHRVTVLARSGEEWPVRETIENPVVVSNAAQLAQGVVVEVAPRE